MLISNSSHQVGLVWFGFYRDIHREKIFKYISLYLKLSKRIFERIQGLRNIYNYSTNPTDPEVNDYISLQWLSYEQPQGSNLRPQRKQIS